MDVSIVCICPRKDDEVRHPQGDTVVLRDKLDFRTAVTMQESVTVLRGSRPDDEEIPAAEVLAALDEAYLVYGIESWTLEDAKGKPIKVSPATVFDTLLDPANLAAAMAVFAEAEDLYNPTVLVPLVVRGSSSSRPSPTTEPTSAESGPPLEPPKPSKRSSTSTTRTDSTEPTLIKPAGDSSSSQSSASAA